MAAIDPFEVNGPGLLDGVDQSAELNSEFLGMLMSFKVDRVFLPLNIPRRFQMIRGGRGLSWYWFCILHVSLCKDKPDDKTRPSLLIRHHHFIRIDLQSHYHIFGVSHIDDH